MTSATLTLGGLPRRLVAEKLLDPAQAVSITAQAAEKKCTFLRQVVAEKLIDTSIIAQIASEEFGAPLFDLNALDIQYLAGVEVDLKLLQKHLVLPIYQHKNYLYLATSDPGNERALSEIKFHTGLTIELVVVDEATLIRVIENLAKIKGEEALGQINLKNVEIEELQQGLGKHEEVAPGVGAADAAPIVKAVNKILMDAATCGASDIHIEPYEKVYRIRFRTDGILQEIANPPISIAGRIAARLKIMSQMDIAEKRLPQDGRIKLILSSNRTIDYRVSTLPTMWGEKLVLRLLDPSQASFGIDRLGFELAQKSLYVQALGKPQGMILVTGPTGSGKTVSLYTGLNILNQAHRNISTAEDPVEINVEGINQVQINTRIGLDFASTLRAFMRQDPDVVMIGEIRDLETADIAIKAAQTGHLVLSTLHTNSASEAISRLRNIGIASYNLASSLKLIVAQRLVRRLCNHCKEKVTISENILIKEGLTAQISRKLDTYKAVGCNHCRNGYKGRVGIYEVVPITDGISRIIIRDGNSMDIADQARNEGFHSLRHSALLKVAQGLTSLEEANRLT